MLKEVRNWYGWIPTCYHAIIICCDVGGGDGSSKKSKRLTLANLGDEIFDSGHVFF